MKPPAPSVITNAFYAFYDLQRPAYQAYAAAHLSPEEARIAVAHTFALIAEHWSRVITERRPSAWAWQCYTRTVARRSGRTPTAAEDVRLLYEQLLLSIDQIATVTGEEPATVTARLAAAHRSSPKARSLPGARETRRSYRCRHPTRPNTPGRTGAGGHAPPLSGRS
ncbi:hypothetical protein NW249_23430 [Streptomyces sp. OUCMDZ-4982]|uniref:hypothetical protein n=1 Tax=Streptomyces sp. OUCMDZ-4982 TaxID=2973090 RepID=UPI00215C8517|nr:hypothetical protein [Streptomyces sp. OUCMDZ-4982]MCR8945073.1 hypothetical protein [Streptomyces sp. OUCMDZ-4982]